MKQLIEITEDENFKKQLEEQYKEYKEIRKLAEQKLNERGYDEKESIPSTRLRHTL